MRQDNDESIHTFGAWMRGQARVCKYNITCPNCSKSTNFIDCILRDVLAHGILDLLGDTKQDMTLEQMLKFIESKESGKHSASCLHDSKNSQAAASSSYNRMRHQAHKEHQPTTQTDTALCTYCGKTGHGTKALSQLWRHECQLSSTAANAVAICNTSTICAIARAN